MRTDWPKFLLVLCLALVFFASGYLVAQSDSPKPVDYKLAAEYWQRAADACAADAQRDAKAKELADACPGGRVELRDRVLVCIMPPAKN